MKKQTYKEQKLDYMKWLYQKKAIAWMNEHDDRKIYSNIYFMIVEAIQSLPDEPDNYVAVAMNKAIREDMELLDRIAAKFQDR